MGEGEWRREGIWRREWIGAGECILKDEGRRKGLIAEEE